MSRTRVGVVSLLLTAGLADVGAEQYVISTYAGGAPAAPTAALNLATDASGNLYFVDGYRYNYAPARSNSVFKIDPGGSITRVAGNSRTGFSGDGGMATAASLTSPRAVAADSALAERSRLSLSDLAGHPIAFNRVSGTTTPAMLKESKIAFGVYAGQLLQIGLGAAYQALQELKTTGLMTNASKLSIPGDLYQKIINSQDVTARARKYKLIPG